MRKTTRNTKMAGLESNQMLDAIKGSLQIHTRSDTKSGSLEDGLRHSDLLL
jgi:hypothetical protein